MTPTVNMLKKPSGSSVLKCFKIHKADFLNEKKRCFIPLQLQDQRKPLRRSSCNHLSWNFICCLPCSASVKLNKTFDEKQEKHFYFHLCWQDLFAASILKNTTHPKHILQRKKKQFYLPNLLTKKTLKLKQLVYMHEKKDRHLSDYDRTHIEQNLNFVTFSFHRLVTLPTWIRFRQSRRLRQAISPVGQCAPPKVLQGKVIQVC